MGKYVACNDETDMHVESGVVVGDNGDMLKPGSELSAVSPSIQPEDNSSGACVQLAVEGAETSPSNRRHLLEKTLKNYKQEKIKCKLPVDVHFVLCWR